MEVGLGLTLPLSGTAVALGEVDGVGYARGLTDRLELRAPLILRARFGGKGAQWGLEGGVGFLARRVLEGEVPEDEDPRQVSERRRLLLNFLPKLGWVGRLPLGDHLTLQGGARVMLETNFAVLGLLVPEARADLLWSPIEQMSVGLGGLIRARIGLDVEGVDVPEGLAVGTVWWHLRPNLDLVGRALYRAGYPAFSRETEDAWGGTFGVDFHFQ